MWAAALVTTILATNPYLDEARALLDSMQYEKARARLEYAKRTSTSTRDERRETYQLLARAWAAEGKLDQAEASFAELLAQDAAAPGPREAAPRIREAFRRAKERLYPADFVSLVQAPAAVGRVEFEIKDPWSLVQTLRLLEARGDGDFVPRVLSMNGDKVASAQLLEPAPGKATRWFAEAVDAKQVVRARLGSREQPFVFDVGDATTSAGGVAGRPRFVPWLATGFAVAAAAVSAGFAFQGVNDYRAAGEARLNTDTAQLDSRARQNFTVAWATGISAVVFAAAAAVLFWLW